MFNSKHNSTDNSIYIQLKKDMRQNRNNSREYIPVVLFNNLENLKYEKKYISEKHPKKRTLIALLGSIIK